jgi:hypothetical protein
MKTFPFVPSLVIWPDRLYLSISIYRKSVVLVKQLTILYEEYNENFHEKSDNVVRKLIFFKIDLKNRLNQLFTGAIK